jgi:hypothetical protein
MEDWSNIVYLQHGSERQQEAYLALLESDVLTVLADYDPILVGTVPLGIETPTSDLDIVCCVDDFVRLEAELVRFYGDAAGFDIVHKTREEIPTLICCFVQRAFTIEIFAQPLPTDVQRAYRHMVVEARLLRIAGEEARLAIQGLKNDGMETEPAFARYFAIEGDPYESLLTLYDAPYAELEELVMVGARNREPWLLRAPL